MLRQKLSQLKVSKSSIDIFFGYLKDKLQNGGVGLSRAGVLDLPEELLDILC